MNDIAAAWGSRLRDYRQTHGINQTQLAEHLGVHQTTVSLFERGIAVPSPKTQRLIIELCELQPEDVYAIVAGAA